ncbi:Nramp family divalent metal transporter [Sporolactobacillus spathodeae]|uniref:Divalent metal cation transporter MntH n=1 Tax=Sporolactobacillus spathodeae TaxID=1465502 RepID=A0ABS2QCG4_9BACL|nr:manganese transport protein [Sporolactobacillus spathodeae]
MSDRQSGRMHVPLASEAAEGGPEPAALRTKKEASQSQSFQGALGTKTGWRQFLPFMGPAFIAAVAYIDPGNYATNIQAGSQFGYKLLWVVIVSNIMAIVVQSLSAKLGIATSQNLPEMIRQEWPKGVSLFYWIQGEIMVMATDLAEFIGAALGFHLVFGLPMIPSALLTAVCALAILMFQIKGFRPLEMVIASMVFIVVIAFSCELLLAMPQFSALARGLVPTFQGTNSILLAAGILGATVMPHAIYMHSGLTCRRVIGQTPAERKKIYNFELIDILIAMIIAGIINALMLTVAGSTFFGREVIADLTVAFHGFGHYLAPSAALLFGVGLLSAGLSSSSVGTLAGDIMMQGFVRMQIPVFIRRVCTMLPPIILILSGANATKALVLSQVILSFGIGLAIIPLILFTSNKRIMRNLVNHKITTAVSWLITLVVVLLNIFLLIQTFAG